MIRTSLAFAAVFAVTAAAQAQQPTISIITTPNLNNGAVMTPPQQPPIALWQPIAAGKGPYLMSAPKEDRPLMVCRGAGAEDGYVGKIIPVPDERGFYSGICSFALGGKEVRTPSYEVIGGNPGALVRFGADNVRWAPKQGAARPDSFVSGLKSGQNIAVCRVAFEGLQHPGWTAGDVCRISVNGQERQFASYETMVVGQFTNFVTLPQPGPANTPPPPPAPSRPMSFSDTFILVPPR